MEQTTLFVDVLLPLPLPGLYTYRVPLEWNNSIKTGQRVVVQFGKQKVYSALIKKIHTNPPVKYQAKYILFILDNEPVVNELQFSLWEWIAKYYMCNMGEVMNAALPSGLKLSSETKIILNPSFDKNYSLLNDNEYLIAEALEHQNILTITEVSQIVEQKKVIPLIKSLLEKSVILTKEEIIDFYKPKTETFVELTKEYDNEDNLKEVLNKLTVKAFKQSELLTSYINLSERYSDKPVEVMRSILLKNADISAGPLNALIKKGILRTYQKQITRLEQYAGDLKDNIELNNHQVQALNDIKEVFEEEDVALLHGVTSSGKTEIYVKLIEDVIKQGKQVLYLLPEIALTTQIIERLRKYFGNKIGVYHSRFNENERVEIWNNILNTNIAESKYQIILGARSALFLPFDNLGLVIVDEEHDVSYKQHDPAPRYNARDTAIYLAHLHKANTLLGSATPSIESYYNTQIHKYGLIELNKRYRNIQLPEILVVDLKEETRRKRMKSHFSPLLLEHIQAAMDNKEQVILFQNRRGFSLRLECEDCNWSPPCKNCDVTLIYHKHFNELRCHYCGYHTKVPDTCSNCGSSKVIMKGFGTEKIEEELPLFFPDVRTARMDLDTTRTKNAYQQLIYDFEYRKIDILVGTQMLTKGLDFDHVSVVGILNADNMLTFPDFRTFERSFQQIAQVSGRAGRKNKRGKVIIQTYNPYHQVIRYAIDNDYKSMYTSQLLERKNFRYPPFHRLIKLTLKHKDTAVLNKAASKFAELLRKTFNNRMLGPEFPIVSKVKTYYLKDIIVKLENNNRLNSEKAQLSKHIEAFNSIYSFKSVRIIVDVDPL